MAQVEAMSFGDNEVPLKRKPKTKGKLSEKIEIQAKEGLLGLSHQVFQSVLSNGILAEEHKRRVDLAKMDEAIDAESIAIKDAVMAAREVLLEEERLIDMLKDQLTAHLESDDLPPDLHVALLRVIEDLERSPFELFKEGLVLSNYKEALDEFLEESMDEALDVDGKNRMLQALLESEVKAAVALLKKTRERTVLTHRTRGFAEDEGSYEALRKVAEEGVAEIEIDVRVDADGTPWIHHNATLGAIAGRPELLHTLSYDEVRLVKLKGGGRLATLADLFDILVLTENRVTKINIDIKDFHIGMMDQVLSLVHELKLEHRVVIVSWIPQTLQYMYEQDPNLSYSLSYFPELRMVSKWLIRKMNHYCEPLHKTSRLLNWVATKVSYRRAQAVVEGAPKIIGTGGEIITDAVILNPNAYWREMQEYSDENLKGGLIGKHTFSMGLAPVLDSDEINRMAIVLRNGSINLMAFEELLFADLKVLPIPKNWRRVLLNFFKRFDAVEALARECKKNGIKVNIYDLNQQGDIDAHFERMEEAGLQAGAVFSSSAKTISRLKRGANGTS